jgi:hypothetical protein
MKDLSIGSNIAWQIAAHEAAAAKFQFIEKEHIALNISHRLSSLRTISTIILWLKFIH